MITDHQTSSLYLADCLPVLQSMFFPRLQSALQKAGIEFQFLPGCKDVWAVDYMPVQVSEGNFIQFVYNPDYLQEDPWPETISDVDAICRAINVQATKSDLVVDGGNVVRGIDKVIMCDKVFRENSRLSEREVIRKLEETFQVSKLIFVPWDTYDFTGHADGMVRFLDDQTVLINDYSQEDPAFRTSFRMALYNAGLDWIEMPYCPPKNPSSISAKGFYLNYLQMQQGIVLPVFNMKHDEKAVQVLERVFPGQTILTVESNELAAEGGVLNCISWNILK